MMRRLLDRGLTAITVAVTILAGVMVIQRFAGFEVIPVVEALPEISPVPDSLAVNRPFLTAHPQTLSVGIFSDYRCVHCADLAGALPRVVRTLEASGVPVSVEWLAFSAGSGSSRNLHLAAECGRSAAIHESALMRLFRYARASTIGIDWKRVGAGLGHNSPEDFEACVRTSRFAGQVVADHALGTELGVAVTPTIIANGYIVRGYADPKTLEATLAKILILSESDG